ncbi:MULTISPECIES: ShlB/FhaC/HecB family hemolysin secretion/activation protein [unclassified Polaromonas]|uniref:ShlB/FhaC/HecB family hemolysin secretion/activation protein n=1 Tax=unclassified Polaromonas TaxID=2638319 RepID=UPI0013DDEDAD|nr:MULTISPECIES: ShlB/FhaC/HecB family hemolysin secretion/activation protein [unclassified Polaromonas]
MTFNSLPLSTLTSALMLALYGSAWAQTPPVPDAGQVLRDLQQARPSPPQQSAPLQRIDETADLSQAGEAKVMVKSIAITGNKEIPTEQLQPLVAGLVGAERSLTQLNAAARRITAYYRSQGFAVARAYLPAQDITDGAVTISIIEGRISSHKINNQSLLSDERAQAYLGQVKDGDVIKSDQIDRGLLLLQDTPGVSNSRATLQPGASVGTSELLIEVNPSRPYSGNVTLDNYGSRYTGEYRVAGTFTLASPLKIGDQLMFNGLTSGSRLSFGRVAYQLPVGSDGLKVGAAYSDIHYKLGQEFEALQAHGTATSASVFAAYPFIRSQFKNLNGTIALEDKRLKDYVDGTGTFTPKKVTVTSFGLSGSLQDALGGGGITGLDLSLILGNLSINSPTALAIDNASARSNGSYTRMTYGANRLQRFTDSTFLAASVSGQTASKNLDSSEKFSLGGINAVRAYPQGEASGDEGYRATVELRHNVMPNVQATVFYDWGKITINRNPFGAPASNSRNLAGVGVGVNASLGPVQLRSSLAWRTDGGLPTSIPASAAKRPTLWLQASMPF